MMKGFRKWNVKRESVCLIIAALLLLSIGIWRGEAENIFQKARFVCMECIGIG